MTLDPERSISSTMEKDHLRSGLSEKDKLLKDLDGQAISTGSQRHTFIEHLLKDDVKTAFNQAVLEICVWTVDNFNKVLLRMSKHTFPAYCSMLKYELAFNKSHLGLLSWRGLFLLFALWVWLCSNIVFLYWNSAYNIRGRVEELIYWELNFWLLFPSQVVEPQRKLLTKL